MKQLGPNIWYGDKGLIDNYRLYRKWIDNTKHEEQLKLSGKTPAEKYWYYARKEWDMPGRYVSGMQNYFRLEDYGLVELGSISHSHFPDLEECHKYLIQVRTLYVVDTEQGKGIGARILEKIKSLAEETGCAVILFVCPFGFDSGNGMPMGVSSWEELLKVCFLEERDILYLDRDNYGSIRNLYENTGFQNICLQGPRSMPRDKSEEPWRFEFIYIPHSISADYRSRFGERLKIGLSKFCSC